MNELPFSESCLAKHCHTFFQLKSPSVDVSELHKIRRSTGFEDIEMFCRVVRMSGKKILL